MAIRNMKKYRMTEFLEAIKRLEGLPPASNIQFTQWGIKEISKNYTWARRGKDNIDELASAILLTGEINRQSVYI